MIYGRVRGTWSDDVEGGWGETILLTYPPTYSQDAQIAHDSITKEPDIGALRATRENLYQSMFVHPNSFFLSTS